MSNFETTKEETLQMINEDFDDMVTLLESLGHTVELYQNETDKYSVYNSKGILVCSFTKFGLDPFASYAI